MASGPTAADITIQQTLELLDGPFATTAGGIAQDQFAFWLGSGISLGRVEGLRKTIPRVLDHLQQRVRAGDPDCRFRRTLDQIMTLAALSPPEKAAINFDQPVATWSILLVIVERLLNNYARFLDLAPQGEEVDYLVWEGVNVATTYGDPSTEPDSEHLCLALLILEGVVSQMPSANWDGLIERAVDLLAPSSSALVVCVLPTDLRTRTYQATLYKFHGCAIRARSEPVTYRPKLVARLSQINRWRDDPVNRPIVNRLVDIATTKRTLMLGLSVQDGNIQNVFAIAEANMAWGWPVDPPAYVFSENELGFDQKGLLQIVYRAGYTPATREDIYEKALIRAFAKPLLAALALHVIFSKLEQLIGLARSALPNAERIPLVGGLKHLRELIATATHPATAGTVQTAIKHFARATAMFHDGDATPANLHYRPITPRPTQHLATDPSVATAGLPEFAAMAGLFGLGVEQGHWSIQMVDPAATSAGAFQITSGGRTSKLYLVANSTSATRLRLNGHINDGDDAVVVYGLDIAPPMTRSPRPKRARTGAPGTREVSIAGLLGDATSADELMQRFREELSI
jgi:hypothetical protein